MATLTTGEPDSRLKLLAQGAAVEFPSLLQWWLRFVVDTEGGLICPRVSHDNCRDASVPLGCVLLTRILWTFSAAAFRLGKPEWRVAADLAWRVLERDFVDPEFGGVFWSVHPSDTPAVTRKQIYAQAFAIMASAEYGRLSGNPRALELARELFVLVERHSRDREREGYVEAAGREWGPVEDHRLSERDLNEKKTMNTHLHILEAYTVLLVADPGSTRVKAALADLLAVFLRRIIRPDGRHLGLFFDEAWRSRSDVISYGHDIEASWLLCEAADALGTPDLAPAVRAAALALASATLEEGVDADGAIVYERFPDGTIDTDRHWWPQAEGIVGFLNAWRLSEDARFLEAAGRVWDFIQHRLVNRRFGEWYWRVDQAGRPNLSDDKAGFWKGPYHNGRACLEIIRRFEG